MVDFFQYLGQEWKVIGSAPFTFIVALVCAAALIWAAVKGMSANVEASLRERIALRDDQLMEYKDKLSGASPDEAKQRIAVLENRIAELEPPALTASQQQAMTTILARAPGQVSIFRDMGSANLSKLQGQLSAVLKQAGWSVSNHTGMDMNFEPESKVTITSPNRTDLQYRALEEALKSSFIDFRSELDETYVSQETGEPTLNIRLTDEAVKMDGWSLS